VNFNKAYNYDEGTNVMLKKQIFIFLGVLLLCIMLFPNTSSFSAMECEDFTYEMIDRDIKITGYNGASGNIVIPDEIDGYQVTSIGYRAFLYTSVQPESVLLPEGLKSIEDEAFMGIAGYGFFNITIPKSVEVIGSKAFGYSFKDFVGNYEYCEKLKNTIIKGYVGSVAEAYATKNGFTFIALDEPLSTTTTQTSQTTSTSTTLTTTIISPEDPQSTSTPTFAETTTVTSDNQTTTTSTSLPISTTSKTVTTSRQTTTITSKGNSTSNGNRNNSKGSLSSSPKTGDSFPIVSVLTAIGISALSTVLFMKKRK